MDVEVECSSMIETDRIIDSDRRRNHDSDYHQYDFFPLFPAFNRIKHAKTITKKKTKLGERV